MPTPGEIRVEGLTELQRAFKRADAKLHKELRGRLKDAADPVAVEAARLSHREIRNVVEGDPWSRMRVGVTQTTVYVAPKQRGVKGRGLGHRRRPNLAPLLMDRAMQPALDNNIADVTRAVDDLLFDVGREWERG